MAQLKLGRNYVLTITLATGEVIQVQNPLTIEFDITRNVLTSANVCQLRVYNLSRSNRSLIRYDFDSFGIYKGVLLQVGYGTNLYTVFSGNISQAWSIREGNNFITQIECFDGGFAIVNGRTDRNFIAGTSQETILRAIMSDLEPAGISFGAISPSFVQDPSGMLYTIPRGSAYSGNTYDLLQEITGRAFFIDNQKSYCLDSADTFISSITEIDASTGLLGTPLRETTIVTFDMLLEPSLTLGQQINLQSQTFDTSSNGQSSVNGISKVVSLKHRGMISDAVCGSAITTVGLFYGTQGGNTVVPA